MPLSSENLALTPQALRFYRFAVRMAGTRLRVVVGFPAQHKQGTPTRTTHSR
jgi:hypothetical protein